MKQVASLSASLLARKGRAQPAAPKGLDLYGNSAWGTRQALKADRPTVDADAETPTVKKTRAIPEPKAIEPVAAHVDEPHHTPTNAPTENPVHKAHDTIEAEFKAAPPAETHDAGPRPRRVSTTVRLSPDQHRGLKVLATLSDRSMQSIMTEALEHYFQTEGARAMMALFPSAQKTKGGDQ